MSREQKTRIAMAVCGLVVVAAVVLAVSGIFGNVLGYANYENSEKYTSGETEIAGGTGNLDINWTAGAVEIAYHDRDTILLCEESQQTITEDLKVRWWLDGNTLRIQFCKAGARLPANFNKKLTLTLPEGMKLGSVEISVTSADITIPALSAEKVRLGSTSGDIRATLEAARIESGSTSGDQALTVTADADEIRTQSTSGSILLTAKNVKTVDAGTTSGGAEIQAAETEKIRISATSGSIRVKTDGVNDAELGSTSGSITIRTGRMSRVKLGSTSGNINAELPAAPGFTAKIGTTSGSVDNGIAMKKDGDEYSCGDGSAKVEISATSGDVKITEYQD